MDKKLLALQHENQGLRDAITARSEGVARSVDSEIIECFVNIEHEASNDSYKELCIALSKKLVHEQVQRLKTQEQGALMIEQDDKMIAALEEKIQFLKNESEDY